MRRHYWALFADGALAEDADKVVPVFTTRRAAVRAAGTSSEVPVRVFIKECSCPAFVRRDRRKRPVR